MKKLCVPGLPPNLRDIVTTVTREPVETLKDYSFIHVLEREMGVSDFGLGVGKIKKGG